MEQFTQDLMVRLLNSVDQCLALQEVVVQVQEWEFVLDLVILVTPVYLG